MRQSLPTREQVSERLTAWLVQGISPRRLALTLALGFVLGCIPLLGIPTALCLVVGMAFGLNLPAIQAANYVAMPFQLALLVPFVRLGAWMTPMFAHSAVDMSVLAHSPFQLLMHSSGQLASQLAVMAGQALLAWLLLSIPVVLILTVTLTGLFNRVPALVEVRNRE